MSKFSHSDLRTIANAEMDKWGLVSKGWSFKINDAIRRLGACSYKIKKLSVTAGHIKHDTDADVIDTVRHEIAHALHYEMYVDAGQEDAFYARRWTGRKWVRNVAPHGAEWKRIALKVGVNNPTARSSSKANDERVMKWRLVIIKWDNTVKDGNASYQRFLKNLSKRYLPRRATVGQLYLVRGADWKRVQDGKLSVGNLSFYQDHQHTPIRIPAAQMS